MLAAAIVVALALTRSATAHAAMITVDSLADTGAVLTCALRDAITAANTMTAMNGCAAGTGNDTIRFSVTGTILLASTLPPVTDSRLTINGPASPGITIDGDNAVQVMQVASGATLNLNRLTIYGGVSELLGGGVDNSGTLNVSNSTFSSNQSGNPEGGAIYNDGSLTVTNTTFYGNYATPFGSGRRGVGGAIANDGTMEITNSTFSGNGGGPGGGISNASFASIKNTILATSSGGLVPPSNCFGTIIDAGYDISDDSSCGFSATGSLNSTDPKLDPAGLNNNGGPTQTIALVVGSPRDRCDPARLVRRPSGQPAHD